MSSPTQRSREYFKKLGIASAIVERWNPHAKIRQDVFGFIDLIACVPPNSPDLFDEKEWMSGHLLAVQTTSDDNLSKRVKKITEDCPHARDWLESGGRIVVHGWGKKGGAGKRKLWTLRTVAVTLADLPEVPPRPSSETDR
jgi:hypothetical protein